MFSEFEWIFTTKQPPEGARAPQEKDGQVEEG